MKKVFGLFFIFLSLLLYSSCENFITGNEDFLEKIRKETAYQNAPEVNCEVFVESVKQGRLITNSDIKKKGYPFELSFFMEKDFPGKFDRWIVYEDYSFEKENKEVSDSSIVLVEPIEDSSYEKVRITVFDPEKKLTVVPHCIANPVVQIQVEQKYQGQVSVTSPSSVELNKIYDITLKTSSVLGFSKWDPYIICNDLKENVNFFISNNLELTEEEKKSSDYESAALVFYDAKPVVTDDGTSIALKMILKKDLGSKIYIDGILFSYPSLTVNKENVSYIKLGKSESKVSDLSTLVDPYNLSGNISLINLSLLLSEDYDFLNGQKAFRVENYSGEEITSVFYTDKTVSEVVTFEDFKNASVVFTECLFESNGEFSSKVLIKEANSYVLYSDVYKIPNYHLEGNEDDLSFNSGSDFSGKIGVPQSFEISFKSGVQCKGYKIKNPSGSVVEDSKNLVQITSDDNGTYHITVLSVDFDGCSVWFDTGKRPFIEKITPEGGEIAQAESIEIQFSKKLNPDFLTVNMKKVHIIIDSKEDVQEEFFVKVCESSNVLRLDNIKKLPEGKTVVIKFDDGIKSEDGFETCNISDISFYVNEIQDNIPPSVFNPVLYIHDLPQVDINGKKKISCNSTKPASFNVENLDTKELYNNNKNKIVTVNVNKASYEDCNNVNGTVIDGLEKNHFVLSFTIDDRTSGNSNIASIKLEERVVYLPENMVVPKNIFLDSCSNYERISGDGISLYDDSGKFQASKYFTGTSESLRNYFSKSIEIPVLEGSPVQNINFPFSSFLEIGGVHEFEITVYDTNCETPSVCKFCVYFGPQLSFTPKAFRDEELPEGSGEYFFEFSYFNKYSGISEIRKVSRRFIFNPYNDPYKVRTSTVANYGWYDDISFYFNFYDLLQLANRKSDKPFLMAVETKSGKYEFIDENTVFVDEQLSDTLDMFRKHNKDNPSTIAYYTHDMDPNIPEDMVIPSYNPNSVKSKEDIYFSCSYKPAFLSSSGIFDFDILSIDEFGTTYDVSGEEKIKDMFMSKNLIGDVVFWNQKINSFFVKHYSELKTLDTSSIPFAVIAYIDQNQIYGIPLEASIVDLKWANDPEKESYNICTSGMKDGTSYDAKEIFKEIKEVCSGDFSNLPLLDYISNFGSSLGFDPISTNENIKYLATEWCIPTYEMIRAFRNHQGEIGLTFKHFGKSFPYSFLDSIGFDVLWISTYGNKTMDFSNREILDSEHIKMGLFDWAWGNAKLVNRNESHSVIPVIELSEIIGK